MNTHYLESAIFSLAEAVIHDQIRYPVAIDILSDIQAHGVDSAQEPLFLNICHDGNIHYDRYHFDDIKIAFQCATDNILEFVIR